MAGWLAVVLLFAPVALVVLALGGLAFVFVLRIVRAGTREPAGITRWPGLNDWWDGSAWRPVLR